MQTLFEDFNLTEGLNLGVSQYLNKNGEARDALNCDFSILGELARHLGYEDYGTGLDASDVLGLYDFNTTAGVKKWLAKTGTKLYYSSGGGGAWAEALTGLTSGTEVSFATHLDTVIVGGISDAPRKSTDGTSFSLLGGSPPTAKFWVTFDNKVYALHLVGATSRMQWSGDGTIEVWDANSVQDVTTNIGVGDEITGATVNNNNLLIYKNYSTWKWDTSELRCIHATVGCRASDSIATIDDWSFWLGHKGIMATNGGKPFRISKPVKPFIDAISDITAPVGWAEDNFFYLYIGTVTVAGIGTITHCLLSYDYDNNVWSYKSLNHAVKKAAILTTSGNVRSAYFGDDAGQVFKFKTGNNDNGQPIPFKWVGSPYMSGYPHLQKDYKYLYVYLDGTANTGIDVYYSLDFQDFKKLGTATKTITELAFPAGTKANNIRLMYASNTDLEQQKILGHQCMGSIMPGRLGDVE